MQLGSSAYPLGLAKLNETIYWGDWDSFELQSSTITGENGTTLYTGTHRIQHLTLIPSSDLNEFRNGNPRNPCEGQGCSHICALNAQSFTCLCPDGLHLAEDNVNCVVDPNVN